MDNRQLKFLTLVGCTSVVAVALFVYFKQKNSDYDEEDELEFGDLNVRDTCATAMETVVEMEVPCYAVGYIIGRNGIKIKQLKSEFGVRFDFEKEDLAEESPLSQTKKKKTRTLRIKGDREKVQLAEEKVKLLISEAPETVADEMFVPTHASGIIIGKGGRSIKDLCKTSGAKITFEDKDPSDTGKQRKLTITGTKVQIDYAKLLVEEKVQLANSRFVKEVRSPIKYMSIDQLPRMQLPEPGTEFQVFVSAVLTPNKFWIQMVNQEATQLDTLNKDLSELYGKMNATQDRLVEGNINAICVARFPIDREFYRAYITKFNIDRTAEVNFFDFGDTGPVPLDDIKVISEEFLKLPIQAVECSLPVLPTADSWSPEAVDKFEDVTHCAQWMPLVATIITQRESKIILKLVDKKHGDLDIATNLVTNGHAIHEPT